MRYLLYGYYGYANFGDDLLLQAVIDGIRLRDPGAAFEVHNLNPVKAFGSDSAVHFTGLARMLQGIRRKPWRVVVYLATFARTIDRSDVLVIGGGTLFIDKGRINVSLVLLLLAAWYARLKGKRVIISGVAVDRLESRVSAWVTRRIFSAAEFIALRDSLSLPYVAHVPAERVRVSADLVMSLDIGQTPADLGRSRSVVGLCFIDYFRTVELSDTRHRQYIKTIIDMIERYGDFYDFDCLAFQSGIGQRDDWLFDVVSKRFPGLRMLRVDSLESAREMAQSVDIFVTTRFHLALLGAIWNKPVVVIDHELKMRAIAEDFDLPVVSLSDFIGGGLKLPELLRRYDPERTASRCRKARERAACNFAWLERPSVPAAGKFDV